MKAVPTVTTIGGSETMWASTMVQESRGGAFLMISASPDVVMPVRRALSPHRRVRVVGDPRMARQTFAERGHWCGLVLDEHVADEQGIVLLSVARAAWPEIPALLISHQPSTASTERAFALSATIAARPPPLDDIMPFLFRAMTHEAVCDDRVSCLVEALVRARVLTYRESELLVHVLADTPRERITERMGITTNTLKGHVRSLLRKLEASDLDKLALRMFRIALSGGRSASASSEAESGERPALRGPTVAVAANEPGSRRASGS